MSVLEFACRLVYPTGFCLDVAFATDSPITALFGPSGSGKTSALSLIAGVRTPTRGSIHLGGRVLVDRAARVWLPPEKRRVGYVFQEHLLFPHLSVRQNLLYGWRRRATGARTIDFGRVVQVLELGDLLERPPHTLSGGQRQRIAFGRALLSGPDLLLLDEPLVSLEQPLRERVLDYLERALAEWRIPALYVTHEPAEVKRLANHVIVLHEGKVVATGRPAETI